MKFGFLKALTCIFAAVSIDAASEDSAAQKYAWECQERTDKMSGRVTKSVTGISNNFVQGWLKSYPIVLVYHVGGGIDLYADGMGFETDDAKCDEYSCESIQYARVKFDKSPPIDVKFEVDDKNNEFMSIEVYDEFAKRDNIQMMINGMKKHNLLNIELELFNTKGKQQIVEFDLSGFSKVASECRQP